MYGNLESELFGSFHGEPDHFSTVFAKVSISPPPLFPPPAAEEGPGVNVERSVSSEVPVAHPGDPALRSDDHGGGDR